MIGYDLIYFVYGVGDYFDKINSLQSVNYLSFVLFFLSLSYLVAFINPLKI